MKVLIIIDAQEDFCGSHGVLSNEQNYNIAKQFAEWLKTHKYDYDRIICTLDTHDVSTYLKSNEYKHLPVVHCVDDTFGWTLQTDILYALNESDGELSDNVYFAKKQTFGFTDWYMLFEDSSISAFGDGQKNIEYDFCGFCTDICVVSNALILKALQPESKISILQDFTGGTTEENKDAAIKVMQSCHIEVK